MAAQRKRKSSWVKLNTTAVPKVESCSWLQREEIKHTHITRDRYTLHMYTLVDCPTQMTLIFIL